MLVTEQDEVIVTLERVTERTRRTIVLPPEVELEYQNSPRRYHASREDFYAGFIAALRARRIMARADHLIAEYDAKFEDDRP